MIEINLPDSYKICAPILYGVKNTVGRVRYFIIVESDSGFRPELERRQKRHTYVQLLVINLKGDLKGLSFDYQNNCTPFEPFKHRTPVIDQRSGELDRSRYMRTVRDYVMKLDRKIYHISEIIKMLKVIREHLCLKMVPRSKFKHFVREFNILSEDDPFVLEFLSKFSD